MTNKVRPIIIKKPQPNQFMGKLDKSKEVKIESLYTGQLTKSGKVLIGKCPFHAERTPSFRIYPETNTWNCFAGCGGGDVVSFYMKQNNCDFQEALKELTNDF